MAKNRMEPITIALPKPVLDKIRERCKDEDRSVASWFRQKVPTLLEDDAPHGEAA